MTTRTRSRKGHRWGVSIPWYHVEVLQYVETHPGCYGTQLCKRFTTHGIYVLINRLERQGFLRKVPEKIGPNLFKYLYLTRKGELFLEGMRVAEIIPRPKRRRQSY